MRGAKLPLLVVLATAASLCVIPELGGAVSSKTSTASKQVQQQANQTSSSSAQSARPGKPETKLTEGQQEQSTDLSASYVPIPIAQANSDGLSEAFGPSTDNENSPAESAGNTWTGPWPKKFQIGYIKQSDLHQVLIESLKGDPFGSLSSKSAGVAPTTAAPPSSPQKQLAAPQNQPEVPKIPLAQWPPVGAAHNHNKNFQNFRDKMAFQAAASRFPAAEMGFYLNQRPGGRLMALQPKQHFNPTHNNQRPQFLFAAGQNNFPKPHNNQPVYGISNFQSAEGLNQKSFQQLPASQFGSGRPQKSMEYFSQWRPMGEEPAGGQQNLLQHARQPDYQTIHDGFDDGFNAPSKDAQAEGPSMSRHPMLNNYIQSNSAAGRPAPSLLKAREIARQEGAVKGAATKGGVKGSSEPAAGTKSARDNGMSLTGSRRRASNGTSTTASSLDGTTGRTETTTLASMAEEANSTATTTASPIESTTTQLSVVSTTTQAEPETTEPESESVDVDTSTEGGEAGSSTTASSVEQQDVSRAPDSTTSSTSSEGSSDSAEVATKSPVTPTASLPSLQDDSTSTTTNSPSSSQRSNSAPAPSSTTSSSREETTPASEQPSSTQKSPSKTEGMSDEALLAQTGSDIGKTSANQQSRQKATNTKRTRSSERLVQAQPVDRKPSAGQASNKLITKKPQPAKEAGKRSGKQVGGVKGVKGGVEPAKGAAKSARKAAGLRRKSAASSQKLTRMAAAPGERSQRQAQVVSMSAAQAQSTAQTLASLLLARCLSSNNCAHLLDICTTKQAMVPLPVEPEAGSGSGAAGNQSLAWSTPVGLMSSGLMSLTQALQADKVLKVFPQWRDAIENIVDQETQTGYTLILPSNEAIERLPVASLDAWLANSELMGQIIDNHILDSAESLEPRQGASQTRMIRSKGLQVNQHRDKMVTINGKRVIYANQPAPSGGRIHVIDGVLDGAGGSKLLDIMDTLKQCDKFDGFVTLAEGTGLMQILKQDAPMTVFVPSNEALRKIPDEELDVIKNNNTALKEFLMYHVVNGSYFSQDLRDGQQLASILDMKPIQVGVRVDGCSRRLVEANTSPMRRPDIVAKNGVIHILDWYLTVRDNDWCDSMSGQQTASSGAGPTNTMLPNANSERLQQLASEQNLSYSSRMELPANHKLDSESSDSPKKQAIHQTDAQMSSPSIADFGAKSIIITATPIGDQSRAA